MADLECIENQLNLSPFLEEGEGGTDREIALNRGREIQIAEF